MRTLHEKFTSDSPDDSDAPAKPDILGKTESFLVRLKRKMGIIREPN